MNITNVEYPKGKPVVYYQISPQEESMIQWTKLVEEIKSLKELLNSANVEKAALKKIVRTNPMLNTSGYFLESFKQYQNEEFEL